MHVRFVTVIRQTPAWGDGSHQIAATCFVRPDAIEFMTVEAFFFGASTAKQYRVSGTFHGERRSAGMDFRDN